MRAERGRYRYGNRATIQVGAKRNIGDKWLAVRVRGRRCGFRQSTATPVESAGELPPQLPTLAACLLADLLSTTPQSKSKHTTQRERERESERERERESALVYNAVLLGSIIEC